MPNVEFCRAVNTIAKRLFPYGFDTSPNPPNSFLDLALHIARTGRMCVTNAEPNDHEFDSAATWQSFRAWHDHCHIQGGHPFSLRGECAAVRMQVGQLMALYGPSKCHSWLPILHNQIIRDNFGNEAFCPTSLR